MTETTTGTTNSTTNSPPRAPAILRRGRWAARAAALLVGTLLGAAVGHGLAWKTANPLPDDPLAHEIAANFVAGQRGEVSRDDQVWRTEPAGWAGAVFGYRPHLPGEVTVRFRADPDSPLVQPAHATTVARNLPQQGWQRVRVDEPYAAVHAVYAGYDVRYGAVLADPPESTEAAAAGWRQDVVGVAVVIRPDTPRAAPFGLLVGGLAGALLALAAVGGVQRVLRRCPRSVRSRVTVMFALGVTAVAPGSLVTLGLLFLFLGDDLPQEPLWFAYSLRFTRLPTIGGVLLLFAAAGVALTARPRPNRHAPP